MKYFYTLTVFSLFASVIYSQNIVESSTKEAISNAGLTLTTFDNYYSNPSALADLKSVNFQTTLKNFYELEALFSKSLAFGFPIKNQNAYASIYFQNTGASFFRHQNLGMGLGKRISKQISIGANFQLGNQVIEGWSTPLDFGISFGFLFAATEKVNFATVFRTIKNSNILSFGMDYELIEHLNLYFQIDKELKSNIEYRYGLIYSINKNINIALGMIPLQSSITLGTTFHLKDKIELGVSFQKDLYLGYSPSTSLKFYW